MKPNVNNYNPLTRIEKVKNYNSLTSFIKNEEIAKSVEEYFVFIN